MASQEWNATAAPLWRLGTTSPARNRGDGKQLSFKWQLLFVVLGAILPFVLLAGLLLDWGAQQHRRSVERGLSDTAGALATAVDRQIDAWRAALEALATSPTLDHADLLSFYTHATQVAQQHDAQIVLFDRTLHQRVDTRMPFGRPLPVKPNDSESVRRVFETGEPQIVGPFTPASGRRWTVAIEVPVWRDREVVYDLGLRFKAELLSNLLSEQHLPAGWVAIVTNGAHQLVARSKDAAAYVGRTASPEFIEAATGRSEGIVESPLFDGPMRVIAFQRLSDAPWIVAVAAPESAIAAEVRQPLLIFGGIAIIAIGVAVLLSWFFSRRVTHPLARLAGDADDVLCGRPPRLGPLAIREFEMLRLALQKSGEAAREASAARERAVALEASERSARRSEKKQRLLAREVDHRARNLLAIVQSIVRFTRAEDVATFAAKVEGRIMALAHAHSLLVASRWDGARVNQIVEDEVAPYRVGNGRIKVCGPEVDLAPPAAQSMALLLHELTTNAVKYGALSVPGGRLSVTWATTAERFTLSWRESDGPVITAPPEKSGFGSTLIKSSVKYELGGTIELDWAPTGLSATLTLPKDHLAGQ